MKKFVQSALLFLALGAAGQAFAQKPAKVVIKFLGAIQNLDFDKAKSYCTESSRPIIEMMGAMATAQLDKASMEKAKAEMKAEMGNMKKATCTIEGDVATCTVCCDKDNQTAPDPIRLRKEKGKWRVDMGKEMPPVEDPVEPMEPRPMDPED